jgi:hypothetical protein
LDSASWDSLVATDLWPGFYTANCSVTPLFATSYVRDSLGRITALTEMVRGVTQVQAFTYDSAGRLATVRRAGQLMASYAVGKRLR